jgi:Domain of unknown function (DUF4390)
MTLHLPKLGVRMKSIAAMLFALAISFPAHAAPVPEEGHFEVRTAYTELLDDGVYYLNADIDYGLSIAAIEALQSGVRLTVGIQVEVTRQRRMWFDRSEATLDQRYKLSYHALSRRYIVTNQTTGEPRSFSSYASAMAALGTISDFPVIDSALLSGGRYSIRMRVVIDPDDLPRPLNLVAYFFSDWELVSEWYEWILKS